MATGKPVGTPDAGAFWRVCEKHKVQAMFTAPTALRAIKRDDPTLQMARDILTGESLQRLFIAGERADPSTVTVTQSLVYALSTEILVLCKHPQYPSD